MQISQRTLNTTQKREKIFAVDFIRMVCAIGVIICHISCYSAANAPKALYTYANGSFGVVFVAIFFMISGGVLYRNYEEIPSLRQFYFKRWKALFPMFFLVWGFFFIANVIKTGRFFYNGSPLTLLFTLFGTDGYFYYRIANYYIVGEWFFGAIVLLYALYPLFMTILNKLQWKILFGIIPLWIWQIETNVFIIDASRNLIHCSSLFIIGMLIFKYEIFKIKPVLWASTLISIFLLFVPIPGLAIYKDIILGISLFFVLFLLGDLLTRVPILKNGIAFMSSLTLPMFLVQNVVSSSIVESFPPSTIFDLFVVIVSALAICIVSGWCIKVIIQAITNAGWFKFIENFITGKQKKSEVQNGTN